jgi:hypothetical protein
MDNSLICTTEVEVLDTKKTKLSELMLEGLAITHATLDKAQTEELDILKYEKMALLLENQVKYCKSTQGLVMAFTDILKENAANVKIIKSFYMRTFQLQELSLKLSVL